MNNDKNDENYIYYVIGQNLKKQRKLKGFTQEKLAEASNYNLSFIGNLESSKVFQTISVGSLYHLAKILGVSIKTFFDDIDNDKNWICKKAYFFITKNMLFLATI